MSHLHRVRPIPQALPAQATTKFASIAQGMHDIQSRIIYLRTEEQRLRDKVAQVPAHVVSRLDWIHQQLQKP